MKNNSPSKIGIIRGCGWQHIGAYVNLGSYYVLGIPLAAILGFWVHMRAKGLWLGVTTGTLCQVIILFIVVSCTDWEKEVCSANTISIHRFIFKFDAYIRSFSN